MGGLPSLIILTGCIRSFMLSEMCEINWLVVSAGRYCFFKVRYI